MIQFSKKFDSGGAPARRTLLRGGRSYPAGLDGAFGTVNSHVERKHIDWNDEKNTSNDDENTVPKPSIMDDDMF